MSGKTTPLSAIFTFAARRRSTVSTLYCAYALAMAMPDPTLGDDAEGAAVCSLEYDPALTYQGLPASSGPDVRGEEVIPLFLDEQRAVVELDGCLYELDRPLEIDFGLQDERDLLIELPNFDGSAQVFVSKDGAVVEHLVLTEPSFSYTIEQGSSLGLELAAPEQPAPTQPIIIAKPVEDDPDPR